MQIPPHPAFDPSLGLVSTATARLLQSWSFGKIFVKSLRNQGLRSAFPPAVKKSPSGWQASVENLKASLSDPIGTDHEPIKNRT
jgi:hypothetical protein